MSCPISQCLQMKAVVDEESHQELFLIRKLNHRMGGSYTIFGCRCTPPCREKYKITQEMVDEYNKKMNKEWKVFMDEHDKENCPMCRE